MKKISIIVLIFITSVVYANIAEKIVQDAVKAHGGADKFENIKTIKMEADVITPSMNDTSAAIYIYRDSSFNVKDQMGQIIWDASKSEGWMKSPMMGAPDWSPAPPMIIGQLAGQINFQKSLAICMLAKTKPTTTFSFAGLSEFNGEKVNAISISNTENPGPKLTAYIGVKDKMIKGYKMEVDMTAMGQGLVKLEYTISDYKDINGMKIAHKVHLKSSQGEQTYEYNKITINSGVTANDFSKPTN